MASLGVEMNGVTYTFCHVSLPIPLVAKATSVRYHGTVYRGVSERDLLEGGLTFSISVSIPVFTTNIASMKYIMIGALADHIQLIDNEGYILREDTHVDEETLAEDMAKKKYGEEVLRSLKEWKGVVHKMVEGGHVSVSDDRQTLRVEFAPVEWHLRGELPLLIIPCLSFGLFEQLGAVGIPDLPHNCLAGDPFAIRRLPFPKVREVDLGFLVTGKPIEVPIAVTADDMNHYSMERSLRVAEGSTCLHTRNAFVRASVWDNQKQTFRFTPNRGGVHSLCFAPYPDTFPFLQLKLLFSLEVAGPEGVATDPPQVRADVEFTGTIFGSNLSLRDTAVMTEDLCSDFTSQNVYFVELLYLSSSKISFVGMFHKRGIFHVCYHRDGSPAYVRVSTLLVEKGSEVVIDSDTTNVLIDQNVKLLSSASVTKLKVQSRGNLVLKQKSLTISSFFLWSGGTITGHGVINITGYARITTEGYETRQLLVPLYNYGETTIDVQRLLLEKEGCIHNYGNLTLTVSSMGSEGISSILSASERNIIYNYHGATLRIITLQEDSFALLTNRFMLIGGTLLLSGRITMTDAANGSESEVIVKSQSVVTFYYANIQGRLHMEKKAIVFTMAGCTFISTRISGDGLLFINGDGTVLDSVTVTGKINCIARTPLAVKDSLISLGLYNKNVFGRGTFFFADRVNFINGNTRASIHFHGTAAVHLNDVSFSGMTDVELSGVGLLYTSTTMGSFADRKSAMQKLLVDRDSTLFLIDFTAEDANTSFTLGVDPHCSHFVGTFSHIILDGKAFVRGCVHTSVTALLRGTMKALREDSEEWNQMLRLFCTTEYLIVTGPFCDALKSIFRRPGYSGLLNRGEATITASSVIDLDEIANLRGHLVIPEAVEVVARRQLIVAFSRLSVEKGGLITTQLLANKGLVEFYDPMMTQVNGAVRVMQGCFIRLRGLPTPCDHFFRASGGVTSEIEGDDIFHCVELKPLESNYSKGVLTNLPLSLSCPAPLVDIMKEKTLFLMQFRSWPNFRPAPGRSLPTSTIALSIALVIVCSFIIFLALIRSFGLSVQEWKQDLLKPSPLRLTLTWNEFKTQPRNFVDLALFLSTSIEQFLIPFHPFLSVPFPYATFICLRNSRIVTPFLSSEPDAPHRWSFFVLLWCLAVFIVNRAPQPSAANKKVVGILTMAKVLVFISSVAVHIFFAFIASLIGDGIACSTILREESACFPFRGKRTYLPVECIAYILFIGFIAWSATQKGIDSDLRGKATFVIMSFILRFIQISLWKILYYHPLAHVTVSLGFTITQLAQSSFAPPTPYTNVNSILRISVMLRFSAFFSIYYYHFRLYNGWLESCDECTTAFFLSLIIFVVGLVACFLIFLQGVSLPDGTMGDPSIDALRRSIDQIRSRIDDIKKSIAAMDDETETEGALNAVSRLRVELFEKQERYLSEVKRVMHSFYFVHPFKETKLTRTSSSVAISPNFSSTVGSGLLTVEEMESFSCGPPLGKGSYGTVYLGILSTGKLVAVKYINVATSKDDELQSVKSEVHMLMDLVHPNIIRYYGAHSMDGTMLIFMEFAVGGSLTSILRKFSVLTEPVMQLYTYQILSGLLYLHNKGVVHRDIKGENILIDGDGVSKLADFGCSKALADLANASQAGCGTLVGSPFYMAPEVIRSEVYGTKADIWSVGCTVVEMLNGGEPPWKSNFENAYSAMFYVGSTTDIPPIPEETSELCRNFLHRCFERDVAKRASAEELLHHEWLQKVPSRQTSPMRSGASTIFEEPLSLATPIMLRQRVPASTTSTVGTEGKSFSSLGGGLPTRNSTPLPPSSGAQLHDLSAVTKQKQE